MENLAKQFMASPSEKNGYSLIKSLRTSNNPHTASLVGKFISDIYPESINIKAETSIAALVAQQYRLAYDMNTENIKCVNLTEQEINSFKHNRDLSSKHITDDYIHYNKEIVNKIVSRQKRPIKLITFTITTCKRFDLFEKTINSFLNCCTDLDRIDEWLCVDDNSSEEDRMKMQAKYPFFTFYLKSLSEKGHPQSMNIIRDTVTTPFIFHMEDDWKYFHQTNFLTQCMDALLANDKIGQCLINKNYAETIDDKTSVGGALAKTKNGTRFIIHEHTHDEASKQEFNKKYGNQRNCAYWPHFSFRPSLLKRDVLTLLGPYNEKISHFEMDYSHKYTKKGLVSVFLDGIFCLHTGRLTSQRDNKSIPNAYDLNNEAQFSGKETKKEPEPEKKRFSLGDNVKTYVINLEERKDRLNAFKKNSDIEYTRFNAIDGQKLKPNEQLQKIFEGNDYNMRVGLVGVAMSHIKLLIELINSDKEMFLIFEDDITFGHKFEEQLKHVIKNAQSGWERIYLGHHLYPQYQNDDCYNKDTIPVFQELSVSQSLQRSMGGMYAYLITKEGAKKLLEYISKTGMTNGIDTVQQKAISVMKTYYCFPHIVFSECVLPGKKIDSDIQYNYDSASMVDYKDNGSYPDRLKKDGKYDVSDAVEYIAPRNFKFTNNWFGRNINISMKILKKIFENKPVKILEIGSYEGRSAIWMLENLCKLPGSTFTSIDPYSTADTTAPVEDGTYERFCYNIKLCTHVSKFNQHVGYSKDIMPKLIAEKKIYDVVYIDGSHIREDVLVDMDNAHQLLESNGIMLMDDAGFDPNKDENAMGAIKRFLVKHPGEYRLLLKEWQWMIQKL